MRSTEFDISEVYELLHCIDTTKVSSHPAQRPKGGEVYVYQYNDAKKGKKYFIIYNIPGVPKK